MPIYFATCGCGHAEDYYQTIEGRDDAPIHCGKKMQRTITAPSMVIEDIQPYKSMVTGEMITSRSRHREHLKEHGMIEIGNDKIKPKQAPALPPGVQDELRRVAYEKLRY